MAKVKVFLKVGRTSRSRTLGNKFWYPCYGLVTRNVHMKSLPFLVRKLWPRLKFLVHLSRRLNPSSVRPSSLTFHIFDFSSETAEQNSTKLDRKQDLNVLYQVCVFWADRKNKMAALASDWLRHFWLLIWNRWTEFNETWQEARSQRPLSSLCFSGWSEKTRWPPWPLIGWDIFDFSSEAAERPATKLDRKNDLNVPYQVCVLWADRKKQVGRPGQSVKKVAHCTQVHDMWPFGPLVFKECQTSRSMSLGQTFWYLYKGLFTRNVYWASVWQKGAYDLT